MNEWKVWKKFKALESKHRRMHILPKKFRIRSKEISSPTQNGRLEDGNWNDESCGCSTDSPMLHYD